MMRISLTLIVKNEETDLPACLGSAFDLVDEIIVVDTGSTDRTKEVATSFGARVFDFPWIDDFAAARNESLRHASGDWVFWLDADDRLDETNRQKLHALFAGLTDENIGYMMKCVSSSERSAGGEPALNHMRLFRNHPEIRWQYRVHELIRPAVERLGGTARWTDIVIQHTGYLDRTAYRRKLERNLRVLYLESAERADDAIVLCNLGRTLLALGRHAEAIPLLRRSLEHSPPTANYLTKLYVMMAQGYDLLGQRAEALAVCREGRTRHPRDAELLFHESLLHLRGGDVTAAEMGLMQLLRMPAEADHDITIDPGLRGYKAHRILANLYRRQGRLAEAESQWELALAERPDLLDAWMGVAAVWMAQGRWAELAGRLQQLERDPESSVQAALLRALWHKARGEVDVARPLLEQVIARMPQALGPRVVLSQMLVQEGRDWDAAERSLLAVLELEPGHEEARRQLASIRERRHTEPNPGGGLIASW